MSILKKLFGKSQKMHPDDAVRMALAKNGDDGSKVRLVDHFAYFKNELDTATYMTFVQDRGYMVDLSAEEFGVNFKKEASVASPEFDMEIAILTVKAAELKGEYDGWGCPVTK